MAIRLKDLSRAHVEVIINAIRLDLDTGEMEEDLAEVLEQTVREAGRAAMASLRREPDEFSMDDEAASRFLSRRVGDRIVRDLDDFSKILTAGINERTRGILGALFARAIEEDKGISGIVKALRLTFDEMSLWRANTIARTEVSFALNFGQAEGYKQAGYEYVQLIDGDDPDTDQPCRDANGMRISIGLYEEHPVQHPNCVLGETPVIASGAGAVACFCRDYRGKIIIIRTQSARKISVTPNHPLMTPHGWLPARLLRQGDDVLCIPRKQWTALGEHAKDHQETRIEDVFDSFRLPRFEKARLSAADFHGDASDGDVCIVGTDRSLKNRVESPPLKFIKKAGMILGNILRISPFSAKRPLAEIFHRPFFAAYGVMSGSGQLRSGIGISFISDLHTLRSRTQDETQTPPHLPQTASPRRRWDRPRNLLAAFPGEISLVKRAKKERRIFKTAAVLESISHETTDDRVVLDPVATSKVGDALASIVSREQIIEINEFQISAPIYNLETKSGWFLADSIVTHNCRRSAVAISAEEAEEEGVNDEQFLELVAPEEV